MGDWRAHSHHSSARVLHAPSLTASSLAGAEGAELVAVKIADIREVPAWAAYARGAFVGSAERQGLGVEGVDLGALVEAEGHHGAVAGSGGLLVERAEDGEVGHAAGAPDPAARGMLEQ